MKVFELDINDGDNDEDDSQGCDLTITTFDDGNADVKVWNLDSTEDGSCNIKVWDLDETDDDGCNIKLFLPGPPGPPSDNSALQLYLAWETAYASNFKTFTYTLGVLTAIDIWSDNTMSLKIFNKVFSYTSGLLTQIVTTRISDSKTETRTFAYTSGVLVSKTTVQS